MSGPSSPLLPPPSPSPPSPPPPSSSLPSPSLLATSLLSTGSFDLRYLSLGGSSPSSRAKGLNNINYARRRHRTRCSAYTPGQPTHWPLRCPPVLPAVRKPWTKKKKLEKERKIVMTDNEESIVRRYRSTCDRTWKMMVRNRFSKGFTTLVYESTIRSNYNDFVLSLRRNTFFTNTNFCCRVPITRTGRRREREEEKGRE